VKKTFEHCRNKDLIGSLPALLRAAVKAQNIAAMMTGTTVHPEVPMNTKALVERALKLPPEERFELIDELMQSLDRPDPDLDRVWLEEAERRLAAHRSGQVQGVPAEDIVGKF
jgi:putative addiction module component (TIGR02574 family)